MHDSTFIWIHITMASVTVGVFLLACILAFALQMQSSMLHEHHRPQKKRKIGYNLQSKWFEKIPPLLELEKILTRTLWIGLILLSAMLALSFWLDSSKSLNVYSWSLLSWFVFAGLVFLRHRTGLRGKKLVNITLLGFTILIFIYLVSHFFALN